MRFTIPRQRAVLGGLLIALAVALAFAASTWGSATPSMSVVIARQALTPGTRLTAADIEVISIPVTEDLAAHGFDSLDALIGASTLAPVGSGELVQRSAVRPSSAGAEPSFSFPIDREHAVGGDLRPGDSVDVLATFGSGIDAETAVLARSVRLIEIAETDPSSVSGSGQLIITATFASGDQVLDIAHAAQVAALTMIRTTGVAPSGGGRTIITRPGIDPFATSLSSSTAVLP
jgi:Flp pilus assembly protein CpaB